MAYGKKTQRRPMGYGQGLDRRGGARTSPLSKINRPHAMGSRMRNSRINPIRRGGGMDNPMNQHDPGGGRAAQHVSPEFIMNQLGSMTQSVNPGGGRPRPGTGNRPSVIDERGPRPSGGGIVMPNSRGPGFGNRRPMPNRARRNNTRTANRGVSFARPRKRSTY